MGFTELITSVWRRGTYSRLAALLGILLIAGSSIREAPVVRNLPPVWTIAPRQAYLRHGMMVRVSPVNVVRRPAGQRSQGSYEVAITVLSADDWQIAPADLVLEFVDAEAVRARRPIISRPETSLVFSPGVERTATVAFPLPRTGDVEPTPKALRLRRPRVRFILEEG